MIAVDTNVLLRRTLEDDPLQSAGAKRLFESEPEILVTDVVLAEAIWVLTGKRYSLGHEDVERFVTSLLEEPNITFEDRDAVWAATSEFAELAETPQEAGPCPDFSDALIVHKAKTVANQRGVPFKATFTYDEAALALDGMKALPPK